MEQLTKKLLKGKAPREIIKRLEETGTYSGIGAFFLLEKQNGKGGAGRQTRSELFVLTNSL